MVWTDNEDRKEKQAYLKKEIIDGDYDADKFAAFLNSKKKNGSDINNWRFNDLETIVELFKRCEPPMKNSGSVPKH